ncbi:MAG: sulfite exporter TauE/SafE family protein [Pseudomonadota bacterium]
MEFLSEYGVALALLLIAGAFAGLLAGLLGVGGGVVLVPAFFYIFASLGYEFEGLMQICLASSLATIIVTSALSVKSHNEKGTVLWDVLKTWAIPIGIGAFAGMIAASYLRSDMLVIIFGVLALIIAGVMGFGINWQPIKDDMPTGATRVGLASGTGFLSTLMGIGGGSIATPIMLLHGVPIHKAISTSAGFGALIAVPAVIGFLVFARYPAAPPGTIGAVNVPAVLCILVVSMFTTPIGARLTHRIDTKPLKKLFAVFLAVVALNMLRRAVFG